jgi:hypothetical protein
VPFPAAVEAGLLPPHPEVPFSPPQRLLGRLAMNFGPAVTRIGAWARREGAADARPGESGEVAGVEMITANRGRSIMASAWLRCRWHHRRQAIVVAATFSRRFRVIVSIHGVASSARRGGVACHSCAEIRGG